MNNCPSLICKKCKHFPLIKIKQFPRCDIDLQCQCGIHYVISINKYLHEQRNIPFTWQPIITKGQSCSSINLNCIKKKIDRAYLYIEFILYQINKKENVNESILTQCIEDNKQILEFIRIIIKHYKLYKEDINLEQSVLMNTNFNLDKVNKESINFKFYLEHYSVISYSIRLLTTIKEKELIKDYIALPNGTIAILFCSITQKQRETNSDIYYYHISELNYHEGNNILKFYNNNQCERVEEVSGSELVSTPTNQLLILSYDMISVYNIGKNYNLKLNRKIYLQNKVYNEGRDRRMTLLSNNRVACISNNHIEIWSYIFPYRMLCDIKVPEEHSKKSNIVYTSDETFISLKYFPKSTMLLTIYKEAEEAANENIINKTKERYISFWDCSDYHLHSTKINKNPVIESMDKVEEVDEGRIIIQYYGGIVIYNVKHSSIECIYLSQSYKNVVMFKARDGSVAMFNNNEIFVYDSNKRNLIKVKEGKYSNNKIKPIYYNTIAWMKMKTITIYQY